MDQYTPSEMQSQYVILPHPTTAEHKQYIWSGLLDADGSMLRISLGPGGYIVPDFVVVEVGEGVAEIGADCEANKCVYSNPLHI